MRNSSKVVARGVLAMSIVLVLALPAQAKPRDGDRWFDPIVKIVKKLVMKSMGDGLGDPWPKP